jgi:colanic acid biosynthesis glycosyl transferase WcaI
MKLVKKGHRVTVIASCRGYDNPEHSLPGAGGLGGIDIRRIWTPGLGKQAKWRRLVDFAVFWLNAVRILVFLPKQDVTVCLTSPPLISTLGTVAAKVKGGAVVPWVMDLNPDEAVAAGWLKAGGVVERTLTFIQNWSFQRASRIIALDRFMADRLRAKGVRDEVIHVDAPVVPRSGDPLRRRTRGMPSVPSMGSRTSSWSCIPAITAPAIRWTRSWRLRMN